MAKKNKKKNDSARGGVPLPKQRDEKPAAPATHPSQNATRETLESLAIAFMLAFFIRTFVVEPFVIPTGSMSPALQGVHKDLQCPQCGERYRVNASKQAQVRGEESPDRCLAGMCPVCRYTTVYDSSIAKSIQFSPGRVSRFTESPHEVVDVPDYSGDRIIVNKFLYSFKEPERWDVVVFKFPGLATDNYIKRCVGLPEETLELYGGDLFVKPDGEEEFSIIRKPPKTVLAMRQEVHDTRHDPTALYKADWPLRWQPADNNSVWKPEVDTTGTNVKQRYSAKSSGDETAWLRYEHTPPNNEVWPAIENTRAIPPAEKALIGDFNPYNARVETRDVSDLRNFPNPFIVDPYSQGIHWVGDLIVDVDVEIESDQGELLLELVEAGHRFRCRCDVATGKLQLEVAPQGTPESPTTISTTAKSPLRGAGSFHLTFANVDDALYLWVNDRLVEFDGPTSYDWEELFGPRKDMEPYTSADDPGDLAPVGIGTRGVDLAIDHLRVSRDIYYIATRDQTKITTLIGRDGGIVTDYPTAPPRDILSDPRSWDIISRRTTATFPLAEDQFFVMGDNSPASSDARLWNPDYSRLGMVRPKPGGNYLERKHLIGRAISVVWPHTWHWVIPGFSDMRRIE